MAIFLVQHGKSVAKEIDPERGLADEGKREVERIALVAKNYHIPVDAIIHSGKKRAIETAQIFAHYLNPSLPVETKHGMNPTDDVKSFSLHLSSQINQMYVGHLPFLDKLLSYLILKNETPSIFQFQNGGIVCMDQIENNWIIKWTLMPNIG